MNYDYLVKSSIKELENGINFIISEKSNCNYSDEYMALYCKKLLECTFNKFRNDDFEYLEPCIICYNNSIKFIPVELKISIETILNFYKKIREKNIKNAKIKVKK